MQKIIPLVALLLAAGTTVVAEAHQQMPPCNGQVPTAMDYPASHCNGQVPTAMDHPASPCNGLVPTVMGHPASPCNGQVSTAMGHPASPCNGQVSTAMGHPASPCNGQVSTAMDHPASPCNGQVSTAMDHPASPCDGQVSTAMDHPASPCNGQVSTAMDHPALPCDGQVAVSIDPVSPCKGQVTPCMETVSPSMGMDSDPVETNCSVLMTANSDVMGHVFLMSNEADEDTGNKVMMFDRASNGNLAFRKAYKTGGIGSGPSPTTQVFQPDVPFLSAAADGLGSQGSLILSAKKTCLIGTNAGSNSVFSFKINKGEGLEFKSVIHSGGVFPNSLAIGKTRNKNGTYPLFILNALKEGAIGMAAVDDECNLMPGQPSLPDMLQKTSVSLGQFTETCNFPEPGEVLTSPAQIGLSPDGTKLVVTIKGGPESAFSGRVLVFDVGCDGVINSQPQSSEFAIGESDGVGNGGPFSFVFLSRDTLAITHAYSHTVGTYKIVDNTLMPVSEPVPTGAKFPCWIKRSSKGIIVGNFGEIKVLDANLKQDGSGIFSSFNVFPETGMIDNFNSQSGHFCSQDNGNHIIDFDIVKSYDQNAGCGSKFREFLYGIQPRTGNIAIMEVLKGVDGSALSLKKLGTIDVTSPGVDPNSPTINAFDKRCFDYCECEQMPAECMASSLQGIAGF